ncbi:hypothetical protein [Pseudomonas sp. MPC6]|uniref:hypothetical protein n=1 Tax=unclassified Pseudomonas TaxID=196821 RepID=UPI0013757CEA|nr:hypothetical protein [Pseudomonas sp. MPC6]
MSSARDDSPIKFARSYDAMLGLSRGQTERRESLLLKILEGTLMHLVMEAAGRA